MAVCSISSRKLAVIGCRYAASALRIYIRLLRTSGRNALELAVQFAGLMFFFFMAAVVGMSSIFFRQPSLFILLIPVVLLGSSHALAIVAQVHHMVRRLF